MPKMIKNKQTNPPTRINQLIEERKIPYSDIIDKTEITQSALSMILNGQRSLTLNNLIKFAKYFNVSMDYLLYFTNKPNINK